jgi:peptide methionine sulfoxide reductase MsrA
MRLLPPGSASLFLPLLTIYGTRSGAVEALSPFQQARRVGEGLFESAARRSILGSLVTGSAGLLLSGEGAAAAETDKDTSSTTLTNLYFGVGCFWHIQHEMVEAERELLGRSDLQLTSRAGYAGGTRTDSEGRVCYHNFQSIADYGKLGHAEVVGLTIPETSIGDFSSVYFSLFDPKTKNRVDPQDKGTEYRSLIGLPGGTKHPQYAAVEAAATEAGFTLQPGKGNDPDTLGKQLVWVYDSNKFPFYQAEIYHQFHDDFQSPAYGRKYNNLANVALEDGRIVGTGCPDRV